MFSKKVVIILLTTALIGAGAIFVGCSSPAPTPTPAAASAPLTGTLSIIGSTSVGPYAEELAAAFDAKNDDKTSVGVSQVGSGPGIKAVIDGTADIGMSSRELTDEEKAKGLVTYKICYDGIAVIVNKANPVNSLTMDQIRDIFAGNVTSWKQFGGDDAGIIVVTREAGSGTRSAFDELVMKKANITAKAIQQSSTGAVTAYVAGNKNAIGYISYGSLDVSQVRPVAVNGVEPSVATIKDGSYIIQRPFLLVTRGEATGLSKAFIEFVLSPEGQAMLAKHNLVTV
ncbi:phosphate ABC transporter substrate-binding protein [Methanocella conradii]|uniref:phosphate ABC transporter substrate-binding protein n=1 Tax=Methanocella conradii TaxID=1175444 RepID=UPI0024B3B296|nr:phosphate ABC transporter substrate-binding protein [Methanocella conradii]MDI6896412.1 phosphate ABC transporter substrate-binding protein [Methanocella conradii]